MGVGDLSGGTCPRQGSWRCDSCRGQTHPTHTALGLVGRAPRQWGLFTDSIEGSWVAAPASEKPQTRAKDPQQQAACLGTPNSPGCIQQSLYCSWGQATLALRLASLYLQSLRPPTSGSRDLSSFSPEQLTGSTCRLPFCGVQLSAPPCTSPSPGSPVFLSFPWTLSSPSHP